jgi:hypothetical protein
MKPGTRCECESQDKGHIHHTEKYWARCTADAVRTVRITPESPLWVAMCAACAEYHERRSK